MPSLVAARYIFQLINVTQAAAAASIVIVLVRWKKDGIYGIIFERILQFHINPIVNILLHLYRG